MLTGIFHRAVPLARLRCRCVAYAAIIYYRACCASLSMLLLTSPVLAVRGKPVLWLRRVLDLTKGGKKTNPLTDRASLITPHG